MKQISTICPAVLTQYRISALVMFPLCSTVAEMILKGRPIGLSDIRSDSIDNIT